MTCYCFHRDLTPDMVIKYMLVDGVLWKVYTPCPVHGVSAIEPVAAAWYAKADVVQTSAGMED